MELSITSLSLCIALISASSLISKRVRNSFLANCFSRIPKYLVVLIRLVLEIGLLKIRSLERDLLLDFFALFSALLLRDYLYFLGTAGKMKEKSSCFT